MEKTAIIEALGGLPGDADDADVFDRIRMLRNLAEDDSGDISTMDLIKLGKHENVGIDSEGAHVTLFYPLKSGTETIETIRVRRPTAKHLRKMQEAKGTPIGNGLVLIEQLTGLPMITLEKLDASDANVLLNLANFLQLPPRKSGPKS